MEKTFEIKPNTTFSKLDVYYDVIMKKSDGTILFLGTVSSIYAAENLIKEIENLW